MNSNNTLAETRPTPAAYLSAKYEACGYPPLASVTSPAVTTGAAAYYLNRKEQTLRCWACLENGPLRPLRVHGRLAWPVAELRRILGAQ